MTTYDFKADKVWCGCFTGTLAEFEAQVIKTHAENPRYLNEYLKAIEYLKSIRSVEIENE